MLDAALTSQYYKLPSTSKWKRFIAAFNMKLKERQILTCDGLNSAFELLDTIASYIRKKTWIKVLREKMIICSHIS